MKLGLLTGVLGDNDRAKAFDICAELGLDAVELGTGRILLGLARRAGRDG